MTAYRDAFIAFYPAYEIARLRWTALQDPSNPNGGRLNFLTHARELLDHTRRVVTTPNQDTLYSSARLDLRLGPVVVHAPRVPARYWSLQFLNLHTDNLAILGRRADGDGPLTVAVSGPGWQGPLPVHTHHVAADTHDLWLLGRILVDGPEDLPAVHALQDGFRVQPPHEASAYPMQQVKPAKDPDAATFVDVLAEMLARNPPQGAAARHAAAASTVGLGRRWAELAPQLQQGWLQHWPALVAELRDTAALTLRVQDGWEIPPPQLGAWGDALALRAQTALRGIAALDLAETLYLSTAHDLHGRPLTGAQRWRLSIPPGGVPARAFWSITLYEVMPDRRLFFTANPLGRYSVGNRTRGLRAQPDGSMVIDVQADAPADPSNWLPAPAGPFRLTLRAYLPEPALLQGRSPLPRVELRAS